ncbi:cyclin-H1-1 isoform X2 [Salvia divinorum]|uniref:Cyclin-H1-1 isoform X2 n=1 Tax=Salvia divinorum TaxID=28513 RepID=A0ABD1HZF3_SALDI
MILDNEMLVLQSLGFNLIVYSPYRPLEGFITDMQEFGNASERQSEIMKDFHESAKAEVDRIMRMEAPHSIPTRAASIGSFKKILWISKLETATSKDVNHIDRKLKSCLDPTSHEKSKKRKHTSKEASNEMHDM